MKKKSPLNILTIPVGSTSGGFTLVELLVVISIIALLAALGLTAMRRAKQTAAETKSLAVIRSTLQASILYSGDNNGQINTMRYVGDPLEGGGKWVGNTYWGRLQPYLFPGINTTSQTLLSSSILSQMNRLFGCGDTKTMVGTPFAGSKRYADGSGLPVPFVFNKYLVPWGNWVTQLQVDSASATVLMSYGYGMFDEAAVQAYVKMPTDNSKPTNNVYYLPSQKAIMGLLDGHVANVAPPLAANMVTIDDATP